ncbi:MAG TPA: TolC family protein [Candidatus Dormibacteraeota bacterium]|nr:TolC family protein [Candidatus Dormibacteraeota bacterium]
MGKRGTAIARIARRPAFSPGAALLLYFAAGLAVAAPPDTGVDTATEASPAALPRQTGDSVAVKSLLADDRMLLSWLKDNNKDVLAAATRVDQAMAALRQDRLHLNPSLSGSVSDLPLGDTNPPGLTSKDTAIYGTVLSQTVEIGKRGPRIESARLRLESGRRLYLDVLGDTMAEARAVLGRVAYLGARQSVLEDSLASAQQNVELQRSRVDNGDLSGNDFDRLLVDTMLLESEVAANLRESEAEVASCGAVLAAPCGVEETGIDSVNGAAALPEPGDIRTAIDRRPDIQALMLERDAAGKDALLARRRRIPDPSLSLGYTHDNLTISGDQPRTYLFSIGIPLPIFDRGQHDASRAEARARELELAAAGLRERGRADVQALQERRASLERTLDGLLEQAVPKSKGVLEATLGAVNRGGVSMTDLLLARRTHTDLLLKVMDLQFDLFSVRNDLRRALGLDADLARGSMTSSEVTP